LTVPFFLGGATTGAGAGASSSSSQSSCQRRHQQCSAAHDLVLRAHLDLLLDVLVVELAAAARGQHDGLGRRGGRHAVVGVLVCARSRSVPALMRCLCSTYPSHSWRARQVRAMDGCEREPGAAGRRGKHAPRRAHVTRAPARFLSGRGRHKRRWPCGHLPA
jgi:hypothetical protein